MLQRINRNHEVSGHMQTEGKRSKKSDCAPRHRAGSDVLRTRCTRVVQHEVKALALEDDLHGENFQLRAAKGWSLTDLLFNLELLQSVDGIVRVKVGNEPGSRGLSTLFLSCRHAIRTAHALSLASRASPRTSSRVPPIRKACT